MKLNFAIPVIAASMIFTSAAMADTPDKKKSRPDRATSTSVSGGVAAAGRDGAVAGGVGASQADVQRQNRQRRRMNGDQIQAPSSAATSTTGAVYTGRRSGAAAINTNGAASGPGSVSSSSQGDVYSSTDRNGSEADAYGNSDANANEPKN